MECSSLVNDVTMNPTLRAVSFDLPRQIGKTLSRKIEGGSARRVESSTHEHMSQQGARRKGVIGVTILLDAISA